MEKIIVKHRKLVLILMLVLLVPALIGFLNTRVNYDMLTYLPDSMETVQGQNELLSDFGKGAFSMIILEDVTDEQVASLEDAIANVEHVDTVLGLGALSKANVPAGLLPDEIYNTFTHGNEQLTAVFFDTSTSADETINAVKEIRKVVGEHAHVSGMSALVTDLRNMAESEEIVYVIIAVVLALVVMLALLDNWLAPALFLVSIGVMILINMGTNMVFGEISYITKALSAVLQLAVTMDYSIFLWHSYREHLAKDGQPEKAMEKAIKATFASVFGSSATTIAGFIALCFMTFTLGLDLGLVMAKGVLLGVIGSVTVLPALILVCNKLLMRCDHKPLLPKFDKMASGVVKIFPALLIIFVAIIPPALYGYQQTNNNVYYDIARSLPEDMEFAVANKMLREDFEMANVHMILTSANLDELSGRNMTAELEEVAGVKAVVNLESVVGENIPLEILPESVVGILKSDKWELTLVVSEYKTASDEIDEQIEQINTIIKSYDGSALLVGESSATQDMIELTAVDFRVVNTVSIVAIFVIIAIVTGSVSLPVILIAVIESAIFINLGLPYYTGEQLSFITPICISTIQLGATVDYAILITTRYKRERLSGQDKRMAAKIAIATSAPSVLVSGAGLFAATFGVAMYSNVDMIGSMCMLMARGAVISMVAVLSFLPAFLIFADPVIIRTTRGMNKLIDESRKEKK
ncbi:MMPL family transporter [Candidatus Saccharibacteria bacterium]|nr:MMPL family transporter [Candidatus Saccharibacteria bacterium]